MSKDSYTITLPYPPTINTYWRSVGRGRVLLSEKGRAYRDAAILAVRQKGTPVEMEGRLSVTMHAFQKDKRRHDLDNLPKSVLDALAHAGVYDDDSQIDDLRVVQPSRPGRHNNVRKRERRRVERMLAGLGIGGAA